MDMHLSDSTTSAPSHATLSGTGGVCLMRNDFIFNCGGLSVAFVFVTNWGCNNVSLIFSRVQKLRTQFARFYVIITLPAKQQIDSFIQSYLK
ncbi:protein PARTING DANCERS-like isoform X2 [Arachis hypogaea]|uniref:protein PARTING DANCERS-like isoform X2 n=1 Tax=Arachis hypogaea TaxID=3818 RepID=UPI000DEC881F|nr:protein PARTING DANCERS-like [Arachis hypogaea]